jgi:hypothetical protein
VLGALPDVIYVGEAINVPLTVSNFANVVAELGSDELEYSLSTTIGAFIGDLQGSDLALGAGNVHSLSLDTSTVGLMSGLITVMSDSEGVENGLISIPIAYEVRVTSLPGDYNDDNIVDSADYTIWRDTLGSNLDLRANGDDSGESAGVIDLADYQVWKLNFGSGGVGSSRDQTSSVPEPCSATLVFIALPIAVAIYDARTRRDLQSTVVRKFHVASRIYSRCLRREITHVV